MISVVPLSIGVTFKRVFSQPKVFKPFVKDVLGIDVNVSQIHTEYEYPKAVGHVKVKYDLFAEDTDQRIIIEIQQSDFFHRFLFYHLMAIIEQVKSYKGYQTPKAVYTIVVLTSSPRDKSIEYSWAEMLMNAMNEFNKTVEIAPHKLIFLNPKKMNDKTPKAVKEWMALITDSLDEKIDEDRFKNSALFQHIIEEIKEENVSPEELAEIKDEYVWEETLRGSREEGLQEGVEQGRLTQQIRSAQEMIKRGFADDDIAAVVDLSMERVDQIRGELTS
ncbi:MAG: PD-(D/E)XK nuclease family transposase [Chloroflexota bacterium]